MDSGNGRVLSEYARVWWTLMDSLMPCNAQHTAKQGPLVGLSKENAHKKTPGELQYLSIAGT